MNGITVEKKNYELFCPMNKKYRHTICCVRAHIKNCNHFERIIFDGHNFVIECNYEKTTLRDRVKNIILDQFKDCRIEKLTYDEDYIKTEFLDRYVVFTNIINKIMNEIEKEKEEQ